MATAIIKEPVKSNSDLLFQSFFTTIDHAHCPCHHSEMPPEPKNFQDIWNHPECADFLQACHLEIQKLEEKKTFQIVDKLDNNTFILSSMWMFDYKFDDNDFLIRYRSKIVVRGDLQPLSFKKIYANTLMMRAFQALATIICAFNLKTRHWDAVNAFLNSILDIDKRIYIHMPEGFKTKGKI